MEACNTIPPVVVEGYTPKGTWTEIGPLKVYVTGSVSSNKAIVDIYDVFGPAPQTLQGADLLATALNVLVFVPDFFKGNPMKSEWFSDKSEEAQQAKEVWRKENTKFEETLPVLYGVIHAAKVKYPALESFGCFGLCWGGKVTALASGPGTPFKATAQVHPGRMEKSDAEKITIPHFVLASNGEPADIVKEYAELLVGEGKTGEVVTYHTMHHGFMGARADLKNEENLKEYERGYNHLAKFFTSHL